MPDKIWKRKDGMKDEEKGGEDGPVQLVKQAKVWLATFHKTLMRNTI